jgi:hypothetical protein
MMLSEQFRLAAKDYVDADNAASLMEEMKSATLSQLMLENSDLPVSRAEMMVKGSDGWKDYIRSMVGARTKANELKFKLEWLRMRFSEQQSAQATARAEMKL